MEWGHMARTVPGDTPRGRGWRADSPPGGPALSNSNTIQRVCVSCVFAGSGDLRGVPGTARPESGALGSGWGVVAAERTEQLLDGDIEGVREGVPGGDGAGGPAVFEVDQRAPGQAAAVGEFIEGPPAFVPQP